MGENRALFRSINERIDDLNSTFGILTGTITIVCECDDIECLEQIDLDVPTHTRLRSDPAQFVMLPGHDSSDLEQVVERHETFIVTWSVRDAPPTR